ncbi:MAG: hypothetical protein Q7J27_14630 [Syntrophales bacterium]|nr:hypothetical protein [Syntrophales bacterium]
MRETKFRYRLKNTHTGENIERTYGLQQMEFDYPDNFELLSRDQYIECTDKNGVEVFTGSTLKANHPDEGQLIGHVAYNAECSMYVLRYPLEFDEEGECPLYELDEIQVIGNIWEVKP